METPRLPSRYVEEEAEPFPSHCVWIHDPPEHRRRHKLGKHFRA